MIPTFYYHEVYNTYQKEIHEHSLGMRKYKEGETIFTVFGQSTLYYYIESGTAALLVNSESGNQKLLLLCGPGMIFPIYRDGVDYKTNHTIEYVVKSPVDASYIPETGMRELMKKRPDFMRRTLNTALDVLDLYTYNLADIAYNDSLRRICNFLYLLFVQLADGEENRQIALSHQDIASATGLSRPQVSTQLSALKKMGILNTYRKYLTITDGKKLLDYCTDDVKTN